MGEIRPVNRGNGAGGRKPVRTRSVFNKPHGKTGEGSVGPLPRHETERDRLNREAQKATYNSKVVRDGTARGSRSSRAWSDIADAKADSAKKVRKAH